MTIRFTENEDLPAFPILAQNHAIAMGLTKREYFALHILAGFATKGLTQLNLDVQYAVICADKLLEELNK